MTNLRVIYWITVTDVTVSYSNVMVTDTFIYQTRVGIIFGFVCLWNGTKRDCYVQYSPALVGNSWPFLQMSCSTFKAKEIWTRMSQSPKDWKSQIELFRSFLFSSKNNCCCPLFHSEPFIDSFMLHIEVIYSSNLLKTRSRWLCFYRRV